MKEGFMTPPNHVNFEAKKLFGAVGEIIDGAIAYLRRRAAVPRKSIPMSTIIFLSSPKERPLSS